VNRKTASKFESRIVTQLLTLMDNASAQRSTYPLILIGATNKPNDLDSAIRRTGRFDREVVIDPPTINQRISIMQSIIAKHNIEETIDVFILLY